MEKTLEMWRHMLELLSSNEKDFQMHIASVLWLHNPKLGYFIHNSLTL